VIEFQNLFDNHTNKQHIVIVLDGNTPTNCKSCR